MSKHKAPRDEWMKKSEAARLLGVATGTVVLMAAKGFLRAANVAGRFVVSRADVEKEARRRQAEATAG